MVLTPRIVAPDWSKGKCFDRINAPRPDGMSQEEYDPWFHDEPVALDLCNTPTPCAIREQCLLFALTNNCSTGVWGGMSELDRKALRKRWPLGRGVKVEGRTVWSARPEWGWEPPGQASVGLDQELLRRELEEETQEDG